MEDLKKEASTSEFETNEAVQTEESVVEEGTCETKATEKEVTEISKLQEELNQKNEALLRTVAEYQNYRKRVEKEKQDLIKYANEKIMKDLIAVHDNFERAIGSMDKENEAIASVVSGVEMIKKSFDDILERYGVTEIEAEGEAFNPDSHHAVMTEEREGVEASTVLEVFQKGYKLHEKVIRPAMVKVSE